MSLSARQTAVYYPYFDWLRIILATVVMLGHDNLISWPYAGNLAVQVFFALSGWLIGGILAGTAVSELPKFFSNRALRIWIPYYVALALLLLASFLRDHIGLKWLEFAFYKATFVHNLFGVPQLAHSLAAMPLQGTGNHFWSVNAEEQFYLLAPLLLVIAGAIGGRHIAVWLMIAALSWLMDVYASIVFGVAAVVIERRYQSFHRRNAVRATLVAAALLFFPLMACGIPYERIAPVFAISIVLLLAIPGAPTALGRFVGGISYPLYLNHWIGVLAGNALFGPMGLRDTLLRKAFACALNCAVASCHYWYIDRRVHAARDRIYNPRFGKFTVAFGYMLVAVGVVGGGLIAYFDPAGLLGSSTQSGATAER